MCSICFFFFGFLQAHKQTSRGAVRFSFELMISCFKCLGSAIAVRECIYYIFQ